MKMDDDIEFFQVHEDFAESFLELALAIKEQKMDNCPEIVTEVNNLKDSLFWLKDYHQKFEETGSPDFFIIYQGNLCGIIGFAPWKKEQEWGEIGYWVAPQFQRLGIAKRSIHHILKIVKERYQIKEVRFLIEPENQASLKLAESLEPERRSEHSENGKNYISYAKLIK